MLFCVTFFGCASSLTSPQGATMDISNLKTHCVGRYLIDLPLDASINLTVNIGGVPLIWRKDLTPENVLSETKKIIAQYQSIKRIDMEGFQFIDSFDTLGGGVVVHRWKKPYSTAMSIMDCYFISQDQTRRVFTYSVEVDCDHFDNGRKLVTTLASALYSRDDADPIPTEPGFAFEGGFLKGLGDYSEGSVITFNMSRFPGILTYFRTDTRGSQGRFILEENSVEDNLRSILGSISILRKGNVDLHGIRAQELCAAATEDRRRMYNFFMEAPARAGHNVAYPRLQMGIFSDDGVRDVGSGFASDEEALALWETIRNSIRLRPGAM
jgi:hypothetical protein